MATTAKSSTRGRGKQSSTPRTTSGRGTKTRAKNFKYLPSQSDIVVSVSNRETRIALLESGVLTEYRSEREERIVGSIFKGIVQNVIPGMDAAFIDIGLERNAFLHVGDILPDEPSDNSPASMKRSELRRRKIKELIKTGQQLMVQVTKGTRGQKGARVTTRIALPGRYLVLLPEVAQVGVSRKIEDRSERERLRRIGDRICPQGFGLILRTECEGRTEAELRADTAFLQQQWNSVLNAARKSRAPACIHKDQTLLYRTVRDIAGNDIASLVIDDPDEYEKVTLVASQVAPSLCPRIKLYDEDEPIFDRFGIERQLEELMGHRVPLKSGSYLVIDEMEALTAIDVNTGKHIGQTQLSDTILKTNTEACDEVLRQLRLRDMGGIIVVDFIDMESATDRKFILDRFTDGLSRDRARTRVGKVSSLGLVEVTRKRTGESVTESISETCPLCLGVGKISSKETVSLAIERDMWRRHGEEGTAWRVDCHPSVVEALIGMDGENVEMLEQEMRRGIFIRADMDMEYDDYEITSGQIEQFEREMMGGYRRQQVVACSVRRSAFENSARIVGWTDSGYFVELLDAESSIGHRKDVVLGDIRRSFAVGRVILNGAAPVSRT